MRDLVAELNYLPITRRNSVKRGALPQPQPERDSRYRARDIPVFDHTAFAAHSTDEPRTSLGTKQRW